MTQDCIEGEGIYSVPVKPAMSTILTEEDPKMIEIQNNSVWLRSSHNALYEETSGIMIEDGPEQSDKDHNEDQQCRPSQKQEEEEEIYEVIEWPAQ